MKFEAEMKEKKLKGGGVEGVKGSEGLKLNGQRSE